MNSRPFSLRSLVGWFFKKRPASAVVLVSRKPKSTAARERVRSGLEPLEGRIAPAVLVNAHTLTYSDLDGDSVTVTFSKDIFNLTAAALPTALEAVFKFSAGKAHTGAANGTDDVPQQLQLIDLSAVPTRLVHNVAQSLVAGVSFTVTSQLNAGSGLPPGDGFAAIGAIKAGNNALGTVIIDGDLGQIDAGTGTSKVGVGILAVQSIGKFGTSTQAGSPADGLTSEIKGRLARLDVKEDVKGYLHVIDSTRLINNVNTTIQRSTIGQITIGGSLIGNPTVATASDNTGRIEAYDIGTVSIGTDAADGIFGGGGKRSGTIQALHSLGSVTVSGNVEGGTAEDAGAINSNGTIGIVKLGGDLKGGAGDRSGSVIAGLTIGEVTIGSAAAHRHILGGGGESSGFVFAGTNLGPVHVFGSITGAAKFHTGGVFANGSIASVVVGELVSGGTGTSSGSVEALRSLGPVSIGGLAGGDGAGSGAVVAGISLARIVVLTDVVGGKGVSSGAISGGHDPASAVKTLGNVLIVGALIGGEGNGSGSIVSGGTIAAVEIGASNPPLGSMQGGIGALSGSIFAHGTIQSVTALHNIKGGSGAGSASIHADGLLGSVSVRGDVTGGTGVESASIFSRENATAARPVAGNIGTVSITGKLQGVGARSGLIEADGVLGRAILGSIEDGGIVSGAGFVHPGPTASIAVTGLIDGGTIHIGGRLGSLTAGGMIDADIRVAHDLGALRVNGNLTNSHLTARGQAIHALTTDVAIGSITITGNMSNSTIRAGYDIAGGAVNADAQIGAVRVVGNWTASVLAAGVIDGGDDLFGTLDDVPIPVANSARIVAQIASIIIDGSVAGTAGGGDHFGFISQRIGSFKSGGVALSLHAAAGESFEIGNDGDTTVREALILV